jgi:metallo-beta-lactamase class B
MRRRLLLASFAILLSFPALPLSAQSNSEWTRPFPPFRIVGNLYWVGTWDLSSYLIVTSQGNILINSGTAESVPMILASVEALGFKFSDIKLITATHGHFDHVAGLAEIKRLTGAKMLMEEADAPLLESGGKTDFRFGSDSSFHFEPVHVDRLLKDGETIVLGDATLTLHHHPGHTKGASSFTMNVRDGGRDYRVLIANMPSINPGVKMSGMPGFPDIAQAYARTFHSLEETRADIFLASHAAQFKLHEKYKPGDAYDPQRFVDPQGFQKALAQLKKDYLDQVASERQGK